MAPVATNPAPSHTARILQRLPSLRRHLGAGAAIEVGLELLGLPLEAHVALGIPPFRGGIA